VKRNFSGQGRGEQRHHEKRKQITKVCGQRGSRRGVVLGRIERKRGGTLLYEKREDLRRREGKIRSGGGGETEKKEKSRRKAG